jgi:hypothetical protein
MDRQPRLAASLIHGARRRRRRSSLLRGPPSSGRQHKRDSLILARCTHKHHSSAGDYVDRLKKNEIEALQKQLIPQKAQGTQQITVLRTAAAVFAHEIANLLNAVSTCVQLLQTEIEHHRLEFGCS